jgi:hypothetical protein
VRNIVQTSTKVQITNSSQIVQRNSVCSVEAGNIQDSKGNVGLPG